ncbi:MAG: adenylyltransferase/cytidyltransferase family protein [Blastocatellia bacterium]|nr:adenylyltransferase/cytidyltransferase family protein [Blastocatellia bacterium]
MKKIETLERLIEKVAAAQLAGKKIVFANGCFDLLHVGHIRYLEGAKALGDILIVGINSDRAVKILKGDKRPLMPASERAEIISALECVDYVTIFDALTVTELLTALRPNIHAKGTDYSVDSVPERETVKAYGGTVAIVGDPKDHSTTIFLEKISKGGQQG